MTDVLVKVNATLCDKPQGPSQLLFDSTCWTLVRVQMLLSNKKTEQPKPKWPQALLSKHFILQRLKWMKYLSGHSGCADGEGGTESYVFAWSSSLWIVHAKIHPSIILPLSWPCAEAWIFLSAPQMLVKCTKGRYFYLSHPRSHNWRFRNKLGSACDLQ